MFEAHDIFDFTKAIVDYLGFDNYYEYPYKDDNCYNSDYAIDINESLCLGEKEFFTVSHYVEVIVETREKTKTIHFEIDGVFRFSIETCAYNKFTSTMVFNTLYFWLVNYFGFLFKDKDLYKEVVKARQEDNLVYAIANSCNKDNVYTDNNSPIDKEENQ